MKTRGVVLPLLVYLTVDIRLPTASAAVRIADTGEVTEMWMTGDHAGHDAIRRDLMLQNDNVRYGLSYLTCVDRSHQHDGRQVDTPDEQAPGEGIPHLGMPFPSQAGWHDRGFINVRVNGADLRYCRAQFRLVGQGEQGLVATLFRVPDALLTLYWKLRDGDDKLLLRCEIKPFRPIQSLEVVLLNYPGNDLTPHERHVKTPTKDLQSGGQPVDLTPVDSTWLLCRDRILDVARVPDCSFGPSAVMMLPREVLGVKADLRENEEFLHITYPPETRAFHLAFWEFLNWTNSRAEAYLAKNGEAFQEDLAQVAQDFRSPGAQVGLPASPDPAVPEYVPTDEDRQRGFALSLRAPFELVRLTDKPAAMPAGGPGPALSCAAAPGESEPVTFALHGIGDLAGLKVFASALKAAEGEASIPSDLTDVRVVRTIGSVVRNQVLVKDDREPMTGLRPKPPTHPYAVLDLPANVTKQLWITVRVPKKTPAGQYEGHVSIVAQDAEPVKLPLRIAVLPIELVDPPQIRGTYFGLHLPMPGGQDEYTTTDVEMDSLCQDLADHGLNAASVTEVPVPPPGRWHIETEGNYKCEVLDDPVQAHRGNRVVALEADTNPGHASASSEWTAVKPGRKYVFYGYLKGEGSTSVWVQWFGKDGTYLSTGGGDFTAGKEWQEVGLDVTAPQSAAFVHVRPGVTRGPAKVFWDDLRFCDSDSNKDALLNGNLEMDMRPDLTAFIRTLELRRRAGLTAHAMALGWEGAEGVGFRAKETVGPMMAAGEAHGIPVEFSAWDDPATNHVSSVQYVCQALHQSGGSALSALSRPAVGDQLLGHVDTPLYALRGGYGDKAAEALTKAKAAGCKKVLYYWQSWSAPMLQNRLWSGLFCQTSGYDGFYAHSYSSWVGDPWDDSDGRPDMTCVLLTFAGPLPTLRWEAIREGVDDLRYAATAESTLRKAEKAGNPNAAAWRKRMAELLQPFGRDAFVTSTPADFQQARRAMAELILEMLKQQ